MSIDEKLFGRLVRYLRERSEKRREREEQRDWCYQFEREEREMTLLASLLRGEWLTLHGRSRTADLGAGESMLFLPAAVSRFRDPALNRKLFLLRLALIAASGSATTPALEQLIGRLPGAAALLDELLAAEAQREGGSTAELREWLERNVGFVLPQLVSPEGSVGAGSEAGDDLADKGEDGQAEIGSELEMEIAAEVRIHEVDRKAISDYSLNHNFEKIETAEEFNGNWRPLDGSDELEEHSEALRELRWSEMIRSDEQAGSVVHSELRFHLGIGDSRSQMIDEGVSAVASTHLYPEWHAAKRIYRHDWCRLYEHPAESLPLATTRAVELLASEEATLSRLRRQLARLRNRPLPTLAEEGDDVDLDAALAAWCDRQSGVPPRTKLYRVRRRRERQLAIGLLFDLSLSADSFVDGERILDIEQKSLLLLGEILHQAGERFRVDGFHSRTRNRIDYQIFKNFDDSWLMARPRIAAARAEGYTRIGPALRHATQLLAREQTRKRALILLSDGRPNDYDRYEGHYGIADIRRAVLEAADVGVEIFALAIDSKATDYFPKMFGPSHYRVMRHAAELPEQLSELYWRLR